MQISQGRGDHVKSITFSRASDADIKKTPEASVQHMKLFRINFVQSPHKLEKERDCECNMGIRSLSIITTLRVFLCPTCAYISNYIHTHTLPSDMRNIFIHSFNLQAKVSLNHSRRVTDMLCVPTGSQIRQVNSRSVKPLPFDELVFIHFV